KALEVWMSNHQQEAFGLADDPRIRRLATHLEKAAGEAPPDAPAPLTQAEAQGELRPLLRGLLANRDYVGFVLLDKFGTILSTYRQELIGQAAPPAYAELLASTVARVKTISRPFPSTVLLPDEN